MKYQFSPFVAISLLLIILPLSAYLTYQFITIKKNEAVIEKIYAQQMDAVLFSVNQYSNDIMVGILNKLESSLTMNNLNEIETMSKLLYHQGFHSVQLRSMKNEKLENSLSTLKIPDNKIQPVLDSLFEKNELVISQLEGYFNTGYRRIEPIALIEINKNIYQIIYAILKVEGENILFIGLVPPLWFILEVLSPKMQQIGNEELILTLQLESDLQLLFSTDSLVNDILITRKMWLFPELLVGISPKSKTISELVSERSQSNLYAVSLLTFLFLVGIGLLYMNLRNEMKLAQSKNDFVSNVSHELRTPLALISMFSETLLMGRMKSTEKQQEYLEIIFKETNRLTNIVKRILNFNKMEQNQRNYTIESLNLNEIVKEVASDYQYHLEQNGFETQLNFSDQNLIIQSDREAIYEALVILIDNAIKYSKERKHLEISTGMDVKSCWLSVKDHGIGIAEKHQKQIFEKFFRITHKDRYTTNGTGLGLTILKQIADALGAEIVVESRENFGSTFKVIFNQSS